MIEPLLDAALSLSGAQRAAFLDSACTSDALLRSDLEAMLVECEADTAQFDMPAAVRFASLDATLDFPDLSAALANRYHIQRELGRGGAAVVFLGRDIKHDRDVAIKVMRSSKALHVSIERFLREIGFAARLSHPHILPLHDSGEAAGWLYYVMPYVAGGSLRTRLAQARQLPLDDCIRIAGEVLSALEYACKEGVIHRDVKPENILIHEGHAMVSDFGIARALDDDTHTTLTGAHMSVGTPAYMSPEQAQGSDVDARTDLYSLGCVLFEMLTGQAPFTGPTTSAILSQHAAAPVPSARVLRSTIPNALDAVIQCAMAKAPTDRYAGAAEFAQALERSRSAENVLVADDSATASIAVLPLLNLSPDPENDYFSEGVTEEILNALTRIPSLRVSSRRASFAFKGRDISATEIGRELNVRNILEGSLRRSGDRIRITVQLIDARTGFTLWSERYDRELQDVFAIQEDIARTIVDTLRVRLSRTEEGTLAQRSTTNLEAYELYLRGRHCWHQRGMLRKSLAYFQSALEKDPEYALAYHGLADGFSTLGLWAFMPPGDAVSRARSAVSHAVQLAPASAQVRTSQGFLQLLTWDWKAAEETLRSAISLDPKYELSFSFHAWLLTTLGRGPEAREAARRAQELNPLSSVANGIAALVSYHARDFAEAIRECERALELDPSSFLGLLGITLSHAAAGNSAAAISYAERGVGLSPDSMFLRGLLGATYGLAGDSPAARGVLSDLDSRTIYVAPMLKAWVHAAIDEKDEAFRELERALEERSCPLGFGIRFPIYDGLRGDARFGALLSRMRLS